MEMAMGYYTTFLLHTLTQTLDSLFVTHLTAHSRILLKNEKNIYEKIMTLICFAVMNLHTYAQTMVGAGQTYTTLKAAFDDINNGTLTGNIELQITSSITETQLATLNASGSGFASYNNVVIYPIGAGYTISNVSNTGDSSP